MSMTLPYSVSTFTMAKIRTLLLPLFLALLLFLAGSTCQEAAYSSETTLDSHHFVSGAAVASSVPTDTNLVDDSTAEDAGDAVSLSWADSIQPGSYTHRRLDEDEESKDQRRHKTQDRDWKDKTYEDQEHKRSNDSELMEYMSLDTLLHRSLQLKDSYYVQAALNLEYLEAEFFLHATTGVGLDSIAPGLAEGGAKPTGGQKAQLDKVAFDIILEFAYQEIGHIRAIKSMLGKRYFSRPKLDISKKAFANLMDKAFEAKLDPPFDVYANSINFFIGTYVIPYVGLTGYVGAIPNLETAAFKRVVAGLLGVESGQDAVVRGYLFQKKGRKVKPYKYSVAEFTNKISNLRNMLSGDGILDEGLVVPKNLGAEKEVTGNVLSADSTSLSYSRTPEQLFATVYGTGNASKPGGFYPQGGKGFFATAYLKKTSK